MGVETHVILRVAGKLITGHKIIMSDASNMLLCVSAHLILSQEIADCQFPQIHQVQSPGSLKDRHCLHYLCCS